MSIEQLRQENKKLKQVRSTCEQQLQKLKEVGRTHQAQIDTLLKFNERLLGIIESQFNSAAKSRISSDLHTITEANQASTDLRQHPKFKSKLVEPQRGGGPAFQQQQLQGFEEDEEEEIYNQQKQISSPSTPGFIPSSSKPPLSAQPPKQAKLDRVFEMQQKDISVQNSNQSLSTRNYEERYQKKQKQPQSSTEIQQLKEMIKQYKQQFIENSSQYQQICVIIHTDILNDLQEFRKIKEQNQHYYKQQISSVNSLRNEIKRFKPAAELLRVMKKLKVPPATEKLLNQNIISKHV